MFQNGVECVSGILVVQDVVQNLEKQAFKAYFGKNLPPLMGQILQPIQQKCCV